MVRLTNGQRVLVSAVGDDGTEIPPTLGTVKRLRMADNGAWVALDQRVDVPNVHLFDSTDPRGTQVLTYPEYCRKP